VGSDEMIASIGRVLEHIDFVCGEDNEFECRIPVDDKVFTDEDVDVHAFVARLQEELRHLGLIGDRVVAVDEKGREYPLVVLRLPRRLSRCKSRLRHIRSFCGNAAQRKRGATR
jgi:hypothetical protein